MAKYRLQTALNVRGRMEKLVQKEYALEVQRAQHIKNRIAEIGEEIEKSRRTVDGMKRKGLTLSRLQFHAQYRIRLQNQQRLMEGQLKQQQEVADRRQKLLVQATQKRKILEILKEKFKDRENEKAGRLERMEMDEIAQNFYLKNR